MVIMKELFQSIAIYGSAFGALSQFRLWKYTFWSGLFSLLIAIGLGLLGYFYADNLVEYMSFISPKKLTISLLSYFSY